MARSILIVDDIGFVRTTLSEIFTRAHYQVVGVAETGAQAIELYTRLRPDLVTMDVVMPEMSGIEAVKKILKRDPHAKIIMISAMGQETLVMEAINAGAKDYILKPFTESEVLKTVDRLLLPTPSTRTHA